MVFIYYWFGIISFWAPAVKWSYYSYLRGEHGIQWVRFFRTDKERYYYNTITHFPSNKWTTFQFML